jgi:hypothetical protein
MALSKQKLIDGLKEAFTKAKEVQEKTKKDSEGNDTKVSEAKNSQSDIAGFIADAIITYASDAEITIPIPSTLIVTAPPAPPDAASAGAKLKVITAQVGKPPLQSAILTSMNTQDVAMAAITSGIVAYTAASFTAFAAGTITAAGAAVMAVPPLLVASLAIGIGGGEEDDVINAMATVIHASFLGTIFTGAGANTAPPAAGPVVSTLT